MPALVASKRGSNDLPEPRRLPRFSEWLLVTMPSVLAFGGLVTLNAPNALPAVSVLDGGFVIATLLLLPRASRRIYAPIFVLLFLFVLRMTMACLEFSTPFFDALQAHKWLLYLIESFVFLDVSMSSPRRIALATKILVVLALVKYSLVFLTQSAGRTGILDENNFELALFCGLVALSYKHMGRARSLLVAATGLVVVLSQSRSGSVEFLILLAYVVSVSTWRGPLARYLSAIFVGTSVVIPLLIFGDRSTGTVIDRVNFLNVFLSETSHWSPLNWLFGLPPITPLSSDACFTLSYYQPLFSTAGDGTCYSVVLHAYLLRIIIDAGLVGLIGSFGIMWWLMSRSSVPLALRLCLIAIAIANSASVSGLNNLFVILPMVLAMVSSQSELTSSPGRSRFSTASLSSPSQRIRGHPQVPYVSGLGEASSSEQVRRLT